MYAVTGILFFLCTLASAWADKFDFLERIPTRSFRWSRETVKVSTPPLLSIRADLGPFYEEFDNEPVRRYYVGYGYEAHHNHRSLEILRMLEALASHHQIQLEGLTLTPDRRKIRLSYLGKRHEIDFGHERNEFKEAYAKYPVVLYIGHSRYGRGPAFESFSNYFRLGLAWPTLEVETTNRYFVDEPILLQDQYPLRYVSIDGQHWPYQYRGATIESSHLPRRSYTKNILGRGADWKSATFLKGKQIFFFYSCQNVYYWRNAIRNLFPDEKLKFVFGTKVDSYGRSQAVAIFLFSLIRQETNSEQIIEDLNSSKGCTEPDCFLAY